MNLWTFGQYEAVIPVPTKRYRRKTDVEANQMDSDEEVVPPYDLNHPAEHYAMGLLEEEVLIPDQLETLVHLLPSTAQVPRRFGEQDSEKKLSSAGAFVHGAVLGIKKATTSFPMSTMVFNKNVNQISPGFKFNAIAVNVDILTKEHKDVHNVGKSLITALSKFDGGELVVETEKSKETVTVSHHPSYFDPHNKHSTNSWCNGHRMVLVAFSVRDSGRLSGDHVASLRHHGFDWEPHYRPEEDSAQSSLTTAKVRFSTRDLPQASERDLPQASKHDLPQASERDLPQASERDLPQASKRDLPQASERDLPQASASNRNLPQAPFAKGELEGPQGHGRSCKSPTESHSCTVS